MAASLIPHITVEPDTTAEYAVIWLHGLGASGHDFEPIVPELKLPAQLAVRFIFPHAPQRPVTINNGMVMPAWYDITGLDFDKRADLESFAASGELVEAFITSQLQLGIPANKIILAGFSQGGALALHTGLRYPQRLGGVMALSTYLATGDSLPEEAAPANRDTPVLYAHGLRDPMIPIAQATRSRDRLKELGYQVEWHQYMMDHSVCLEEIGDISRWLQRCFSVASAEVS
ncbi:MAG TPA: carboxylesterase [Gammaproteobacteria bacterium]|nr:carboxylesterase [Gammaproteobacteria bacterium]